MIWLGITVLAMMVVAMFWYVISGPHEGDDW